MKRLESMLIPAGVAARDKEIRSHMLPIPWMAQPSLEKQATTSKPISPGGEPVTIAYVKICDSVNQLI